MIRRFFTLPLRPGTSRSQIDELVEVLEGAAMHIRGTRGSRAGLDRQASTPTLIWENTFDGLDSITEYLRHPHHAAVLDRYLIPDSPASIVSWPPSTCGYTTDTPIPALKSGLRRIVLLSFDDSTDIDALTSVATPTKDLAVSVVAVETWRRDLSPTPAGLRDRTPWTHLWEQAFSDPAALRRYLGGASPAAEAERSGFRSLGLEPRALQTVVYDIRDRVEPDEVPAATDYAARLVIRAHVSTSDLDTYLAALESEYDPALADAGMELPTRCVYADDGGIEVHSTWELPSIRAWHDMRAALIRDPRWRSFVADIMPLVRDGDRWLSRAL